MKQRHAGLAAFILFLILAAAGAGYTVLWRYIAGQTEQWLRMEWEDAARNGVTIEGDFPAITGFPFRPELRFSGRIRVGDSGAVIPLARIRSFFIMGTPADINFPEGFYFERAEGLDREIWSVQELSASGKIPWSLPDDMSEDGMRAWRDAGGMITIDKFTLRKGALALTGNGKMWLDDALQPAGSLHADATGYNDFIAFLQQKHLIETKHIFLIGAILNGLARPDPETGEPHLIGDASLQDRRLTLGPATLMTVPVIIWPRHAAAPDKI